MNITYQKFFVPFNVAYYRDKNRKRSVGLKVLTEFYSKYYPYESRKFSDIDDKPEEVIQQETLPQAIIVNMDSIMNLDESPINSSIDLINTLSKTYQLIFVSSRLSSYQGEVLSWINRYINTDHDYLLYMREAVTEKDFYDKFIKDKYYVTALFANKTFHRFYV